jgi:hypothetical protein
MTTTADALRAEAAEWDALAEKSFQRCDTDGFLSQWASGITARKHRAEADLDEAGGLIEVQALFNLDGTIASTHYNHGHYGACWVLNDATTARYSKRFVNPSRAQKAATRARNMRAKGFTVGTIRVRGYVDIVGSGTGLSGCASAYVATLPNVGALKDGDFEIVSTTGGDE